MAGLEIIILIVFGLLLLWIANEAGHTRNYAKQQVKLLKEIKELLVKKEA